MKRRHFGAGALRAAPLLLVGSFSSFSAHAQTSSPPTFPSPGIVPRARVSVTRTPATGTDGDNADTFRESKSESGLLDRFGARAMDHLLRATKTEERVRGIERAAALATEESLGALAIELEKSDFRAEPELIFALAKALAPLVARPIVQRALTTIAFNVTGPRVKRDARLQTSSEVDSSVELVLHARKIAFRALLTTPSGREAVALAVRGDRLAQFDLEDIDFTGKTPRLFEGDGAINRRMVELVALSQDLRALPKLRATLADEAFDKLRPATLHALARLRDGKSLTAFLLAAKSEDPEVKFAGLDGLLSLHDPTSESLLAELLADDSTRANALHECTRIDRRGVALALISLLRVSRTEASEVLHALAAQSSPEAATELARFLTDPELAGEAAFALGKSRALLPEAALRSASASKGRVRRLVARALFLRAQTEGASSLYGEVSADLRASRDEDDQALATFFDVARGDLPLLRALRHPVRKARLAALQAGVPLLEDRDAFISRFNLEKDATTRALLLAALPDDARAQLPNSVLEGADGGSREKVAEALAVNAPVSEIRDRLTLSLDPALRAALVRALGASRDAHALGILLQLYPRETVSVVRHAMLSAILRRREDTAARRDTIEWARRFDPDAAIRRFASTPGASIRGSAEHGAGSANDVLWVELQNPGRASRGIILFPDGGTRPFVADADGFVLVPKAPAEGARLVVRPDISLEEM